MNKRKIYISLFIIYIIFIISIVIFKLNEGISYLQVLSETLKNQKSLGIPTNNFIPFKTIKNDIRLFNIRNLIGNTTVFIPFSFFLKQIFNIKFFLNLLISFLFILFIEILQYKLNIGFFDIDDIILNFSGIVIGYFLALFLNKLKFFKI